MAGVPAATLEGCAVPIAGMPYDHTYVTSSCGLMWGCWGRSTGGAAVNIGIGSSIIADCLSQPNSEAGIRYGLTGVCHQTANRILHPAGQITVFGRKGYATSAMVFNVYGRGPWSALTTCYPPGSAIPAVIRRDSDTQVKKDSKMNVYDQAVSAKRSTATDEESIRVAELSVLVEVSLGHPLEHHIFDALAIIQSRLQRTQRDLAARLEAGTLTPESYLNRLNSVLELEMGNSRSLLGEDQFNAIFNYAGRRPDGLVDRDIFLASNRTPAP
jgi:hypothetical protein